MAKYTNAEIEQAKTYIAEYLRKPESKDPGHGQRQKVYIIVRSVAKSGMSRTMDFYVISEEEGRAPSLTWITAHIAKICDLTLTKQGLRIGGTGMDMGFAVLDHLAYKLWGMSGNVFERDYL